MRRALISLVVAVASVVGAFGQSDSVILLRVNGSFTDNDQSYAGDRVDWYDLQAPADGRIEASAVSLDGALALLVRRGGPSVQEISGGRESARATLSVSQGESLSIGVSTSGVDPAWSGHPEYLLQVLFARGDAGLAVGRYQTGFLETSDELYNGGSYIDWYPLSVAAGVRLRIDVTSDDFDTYLVVEVPGGGLLEDDDTNGTNSSVGFTSARGGVARVGVRSFGSGNTGAYEVSVVEERVNSIGVGDVITANLESGSAVYAVQGFPGQIVDVDLSSFELDTTLTIEDSDGQYAYNDDFGNGSDSHLLYEFGESGTATITVGSFGGDGQFTLSIQASNVRFESVTDGHRLEDGDVIAGQLTSRSPLYEGVFSQRFTFYAEQGERVEITLESDSFDSYLRLVDPGGYLFTDDDSAGNLNSRISITTDRSGIHEVYATPLGGGDAGLYTITFGKLSTGSLILSTRGQLTPNDETDISGKAYDTFQFRAQAGRTVVIDVESMSFDTQAILRDQFGTVILNDDDGGTDSNSRIEFVPDRTATFELVVTSFSAGSHGNYSVTIYE